MKKYAWLLVLIFFWGCDEDPITPKKRFSDTTYGSSVIKIPGLPRDTIASKKVMYKFSLTITGTNMEPIRISQPIDETGTIIRVDRIPADRRRLFEGRLYGSNGVTYEGKAYADIYGGKVTNVNLILRRTGAAQVEVILEDMPSTHKFAGCYDIKKGKIKDIDISDLTIEIPKSPNEKFGGYFKMGDKKIGKFAGTVIKGEINAAIYIENIFDMISSKKPEPIKALYKGHVSSASKVFKGMFFSKDDKHIGYMDGINIKCEIVSPKFKGCYDIGGRINEIDISNLTLEIPEVVNNKFSGYFKQGTKTIGKFWGAIKNGEIEAAISIKELVDMKTGIIKPLEALYKGYPPVTSKDFKGIVYSRDNPDQIIGIMHGKSIKCNAPPPKKCIIERLGGIGSTSCKDTTTWKKYAADHCSRLGRVLGTYKFISKCNFGDNDDILRFEGIIFDACLPDVATTP
jgi:hypothetical protein